LALEPLEGQKWRSIIHLAGSDEADEGRVGEPGEHLGLAFEALHVGRAAGVEALQGDRAAGALILRAIDGAHRAGACIALDLESSGDDYSRLHGIGSTLSPYSGSARTLGMNDDLSPLAEPLLLPRGAAGAAKLVLGTMNFGKRTDAAESARILGRAMDRGI